MLLKLENYRSPLNAQRRSRTLIAGAAHSTPAIAHPARSAAECSLLLDAVMLRLQSCGADRPPADRSALHEAAGTRMQVTVRDCVAALEHVQAMLAPLHARHRALDAEIDQARLALHAVRAELQTARAGERQARRLALHDGLTLLPNRVYFGERLACALRFLPLDAPSLAVLYLDLDGFKAVNDVHGHEVGNEMLRVTGMRLSRAVRAEDMVSRLGGDEFACLRSGPVDRDQLARLACKLFDVLSAPMKIGALTLTIAPSIGIAMHPQDGESASDLLNSADAAMYRAKRERTHHAFRSDTEWLL